MEPLRFLIFLAVGVLQMAATFSGMTAWAGLHWIVALLIMFAFGWVPLVGTVLGVLGAYHAWRWPLWSAIALMAGPTLLGFAVILVASWQERRERAI